MEEGKCGKLHQVVTSQHFQVLRSVMLQERDSSTMPPSSHDVRHLDLWLDSLLPSEDVLWQLLGQLTHAKHQLTRTRWRTHDALIRQALRHSMDLAISQAQTAQNGGTFSGRGGGGGGGGAASRRRSSATSAATLVSNVLSQGPPRHAQRQVQAFPTRRSRSQVTLENKELFEMWRQRMQKTESLVRSVRDEWARAMNQRLLVLLQVFAGHTAAGRRAVQDIQQRLSSADGTVRHKCMVDGEDSQSDDDEEEHVVVGQPSTSRRRPSVRRSPAPPPPPPPDESDKSVHLHMTVVSE